LEASSCPGIGREDHDRHADQNVQHGDPEGEPLQPPPPESQHSGLIGTFRFFSSFGQLYQATPEVGPVSGYEPKEHCQQRVLGVKRRTESREDSLQNGKNQKEYEVR
jgi:hypothetical protein